MIFKKQKPQKHLALKLKKSNAKRLHVFAV